MGVFGSLRPEQGPTREFHIESELFPGRVIQELARREVERHQRSCIGITASVPAFVDHNGLYEWCCDVRVGTTEGQGLIKDVLIAQWAQGIVNDFNVPVLMEVSKAGRLTITGRSEVRLPDVSLRTWSWSDLDMVFMSGLEEVEDGVWRDGFGWAATDPYAVSGEAVTWIWEQELLDLDDVGDGTFFEASEAVWTATR